MKIYSIISILSFILLLGCSSKNTIEIKNDDGSIAEKYETNKESDKHGSYTAYHKNGNLKEESNYSENKLSGLRNIYNEQGTLEITENYEVGVLNGDYKVFHPNGQVQIHSNYINGKMEGVLKAYDEKGQLKEEVSFVNNNEVGPFKEYFDNGKVEWEGTYLNGDNEFGLLKNYNREGTLIKKMMCDSQAVCRTIWTLEDGDITPKF